MTRTQDRELHDWVRTWHSSGERPMAADEIDGRVRRRIRRLRWWAGVEATVGIVAFAVVSYRFVVEPDVFERIAMALLGVIAVGGIALSWWQWRGIWRAAALTTSEFLTASILRSQRFERYVAAGWLILAAEIAVFVPWIRYRSGGWFAWGFLLVMVVAAGVCLLAAQRRLRRERESLGAIERDLADVESTR